jgi:hypothetical protein
VKQILIPLAVLAALGTAPALAADRVQATVSCKPAGVSLAYACTFKLTNASTGAPLEKAQLSIGADMPSMPLAHNIPPVTAKPTGTPGEYRALVVLEMHGDWALRLKVGGPLRDQLVEMLNFSPQAVGPARKAVTPDPAPKPGRKH